MQDRKRRDRDGLHRRRRIWYYAFRNPLTGKRQEVSTKTTNFNEARDIQRKALQELGEGVLASDKRRLSLEAAFQEWVEYESLHYEPATIRLYNERSKPLLGRIGKLRLEQISIETIRNYQQTRAAKVSNRTVNLEIQALINALKHFRMWRGEIKGDYKRLPERPSEIGRALVPEEQVRSWEVAQTSLASMRTYNLSILYSNTGLRKTEFLRLRVGELDLDRAEIRINKSKTPRGRRIVPLNDHALTAAKYIIELAQRKGACEPDDYLFPAFLHRRRESGERRSGYDPSDHQKTFRTAWRNFTRKAGLKGLRIHDLRHHFVTLLAEQDVPLATAKSIVGHMNDAMIAHYTHIRDRAKRQAVTTVQTTNVVSVAELTEALTKASKSGRKAKYLLPQSIPAQEQTK